MYWGFNVHNIITDLMTKISLEKLEIEKTVVYKDLETQV